MIEGDGARRAIHQQITKLTYLLHLQNLLYSTYIWFKSFAEKTSSPKTGKLVGAGMANSVKRHICFLVTTYSREKDQMIMQHTQRSRSWLSSKKNNKYTVSLQSNSM